MVVDEVERVAEDEPSDVIRLEEVAREADLESARGLQALDLLVRELELEGSQVLAHLRLRPCPDDRHERPRLRPHPRGRDLRRGRAELVGDGDHLAGDRVDPLAGAVVAARLVGVD